MSNKANIVRAADLAAAAGPAWPTFDPPVYFVAGGLRRRWPELPGPDDWMDLASVPTIRWAPAENIWIVSTYLRLKARGLNVKIVDRLVPDAINVCHHDQLLRSRCGHRAFVVVAEADRSYWRWGEYTLAQSPELACRPDTCLIDHWPQPGLIGRNPSRGVHISRMGYTGCADHLAQPFRNQAFRGKLKEMGVELVLREDPGQWHDFGDLDLHLAVRHVPWRWLRTKPSTKLVHGWIANCPSLLGREPSFRYWGEDGADYFEVNTPEQVIGTVRKLIDDSGLYQRVQENGRAKARWHDEEAVCRQWAAVLAGPVAEQFCQWRKCGGGGRALRAGRRWLQCLTIPVSRKWFFLHVKTQEAVMTRWGR